MGTGACRRTPIPLQAEVTSRAKGCLHRKGGSSHPRAHQEVAAGQHSTSSVLGRQGGQLRTFFCLPRSNREGPPEPPSTFRHSLLSQQALCRVRVSASRDFCLLQKLLEN